MTNRYNLERKQYFAIEPQTMPTSIEKISIALPPEMAAQIREAVETGEYASNSEVVRDALTDWTHKRALRQEGVAEVRRAWQEAIDNPAPGLPMDEVLDRLERKYQAMADAASPAK
jgi:antitoxin ParD1/3/4